MTKLDLYNQALSLFDLRAESITEDTKEVRTLNLFFDKVVQFVLKLREFDFLLKKVVLTDLIEDDVWKYQFGYRLPDDFGYVVQLNGTRENAYAVRYGALWTDLGEPTMEYVPNKLEVSGDKYTAPKDFLSLISYQLALHVAPMLDPESQATGIAAQLFQLTFQNMLENEVRSNDRPYRYESASIIGETKDFDLATYRRELFERNR